MSQNEKVGRKQRGNGEGSIVRLDDGRYRAMITTEMYAEKGEDGQLKCKRHTKSKICRTKREASAALNEMRMEYDREKNGGLSPGQTPSLLELYEQWKEWYESNVSTQTMDCYRAAFKHLAKLHNTPVGDITVDDLQEALDSIPRGKRTRENAKTLIGLLYKYGNPRHLTGGTLVMSDYLRLNYNKNVEGYLRQSLNDDELAALFYLADHEDLDAQIICICCVMGWRPEELFSLLITNVNLAERYIVGGAKTEAGKDRPVPIHERVYPYLVTIIGERKAGYVFGNDRNGEVKRTLKWFRLHHFYPCLERAGIDNPLVPAGGGTYRRRITPHSCRHTFARLLKGVTDAPVETKLDLIGHTDEEQLRDYMDSTLPERREVISKINLPEPRE